MQVLIVGGGMITHDQLLPSLYHLQRSGRVERIAVCSTRDVTLRLLAESETLARAFPGQSFRAQPGPYREAIAVLPPRQIVVAAVPDDLHFEVVMAALACEQRVLCVKPLALTYRQSVEIAQAAAERGLLVAVDYHKRCDDRSLLARTKYSQGLFGEFRLGAAHLFEKWHYRHSNFQNWMTADRSDAFTYIGCHYVDLVHFITGLLPSAVSVHGVRDRFPNGKEGFLWTDARVIWSNGACLNVQNSLGYPQKGPGANSQGMTLYCTGGGDGALIDHSDQYRGVKHSDSGAYNEPNPDFFQYVDLGDTGLTPVGYGYRSIERIVSSMIRLEQAPEDRRRELLQEIDRAGIIATPANSSYNESVIEAGRQSLLDGGRQVAIPIGQSARIQQTEAL